MSDNSFNGDDYKSVQITIMAASSPRDPVTRKSGEQNKPKHEDAHIKTQTQFGKSSPVSCGQCGMLTS